MKNKHLLLLILVLCLVLVGCSASGSEANKRIIRVSHGQPIDHPLNDGMIAFKDHIEEHLGDKYEVQIFANELLGSSKNGLELCQTGAVDFVIASSSNMETFNPIHSLFSTPYLFESIPAHFEAMDTDVVREEVFNSTINEGLYVVEWYYAGARSFYCNKPIENVDDLQGMRIRVQPSPMNVAMMEAFDAAAVPMAYSEVYTAIQNGTIDGAENNETSLITVKHGEVVDYFSENMHQMVPDYLVANYNFMNNLSPEERQIFDEAIAMSKEVADEGMVELLEEARRISQEEMGVEFVETDIDSFVEAVQPIHENLRKENPEMVPVLETIVEINEKHKGAE